jgi:hypothetical protein
MDGWMVASIKVFASCPWQGKTVQGRDGEGKLVEISCVARTRLPKIDWPTDF